MHDVLELLIIIEYILYYLIFHITAIAIFVRASLKKWNWGLLEWSWFFYFIETPVFLIILPLVENIDNIFLKFVVYPIIIVPAFVWMITIPYHYNLRDTNTVKTITKGIIVVTIVLYFVAILLITKILPESFQSGFEIIRYLVVVALFFYASQEVKKTIGEPFEEQKKLEYFGLILISGGFFLFTIGFVIVSFTDIPLNLADLTEDTILSNIMILAFTFALMALTIGFYYLLRLTLRHSNYKPYEVKEIPLGT